MIEMHNNIGIGIMVAGSFTEDFFLTYTLWSIKVLIMIIFAFYVRSSRIKNSKGTGRWL
jgi:hypothetical protein